jgi:hypothetical protein
LPWLFLSGLSLVLSKPEFDDLLGREDPVFEGLFSPVLRLFGDPLDLSSRLFRGLLNTIIFCFTLAL